MKIVHEHFLGGGMKRVENQRIEFVADFSYALRLND